MYSEQNRAFSYAVAASIVLHAMLLFGISQRERARPLDELQPPIVARLVEPAAPAPVVTEPPPRAEPAPRPERVKPPSRAKPVAPKPVAKAKPEPAAEPAPEAPQVAESVAPPAPAPEPAPPPVIAKAEPAPPAADPGPLARYRSQVLSEARKHKRYPRLAMDNNWEGDVVVRMAVGANGMLSGLTVQSSSGHPVLDRQALEMFQKAAAAVEVPPALHGREFALDLRAIYNLRDQDSG